MHDFDVRTFPEHRQDILELLVGLWEEWKPDVVFMPSLHDVHQDHKTVAEEGLRAFKRTTILGYEIPWNNFDFAYQWYVSLEKTHLERKVAALEQLRVAAAPPLREPRVRLERRAHARHQREPRVRRGVPGVPRHRLGRSPFAIGRAGSGRSAENRAVANKRRLAVLVAAASFAVAAAQADAASFGQLPGARSIKVCAAAGPFWPTMTLALDGTFAWVACKEQRARHQRRTRRPARSAASRARRARDRGRDRLRLGVGARRRTGRSTASTRDREGRRSGSPLPRAAAVQHLDRRRLRLGRRRPGRRGRSASRRRRTGSRRASPSATARRTWRSPARRAWVINHRDRTLFRIDLRRTRLDTLGDDPRATRPSAWCCRRQALDHRPRHRSAAGRSRARARSRRRSRSARAASTSPRAAATSGFPSRSAAVDRDGLPDDGGADARPTGHGSGHDGRRRRSGASTCTGSPPVRERSGSRTTRAASSIGSARRAQRAARAPPRRPSASRARGTRRSSWR